MNLLKTAFFIVIILIGTSVHSINKLSEKELSEKKEGWYPTGLPILIYNSDLGFGYGAIVVLYNNGSKTDEMYDYTPYFSQIGLLLQKTTEGMFNYEALFDFPFPFGSKFRLRANAGFVRLLYDNYFGIGEESYRPLAGNFERLSDAEDYLTTRDNGSGFTSKRYYNFTREMSYERILIEREVVNNFKILFGNHIYKYRIITFDNSSSKIGGTAYTESETLISREKPPGFEGGWANSINFGVAYDSRDFEPDPNNGVFTDLTYEVYHKYLMSDFNFQRLSYSLRFYFSPLKDFVIAGRGDMSSTTGNVPFFEMGYFDQSDKRNEGIGGINTVKGFTQHRFIGKAIFFTNFELRWRFTDFTIGKELFKLIAVPFVDSGRAFDEMREVHFDDKWQLAYGLALRLSWNLSFILNFSYGRSSEDTFVAVDIFHPF